MAISLESIQTGVTILPPKIIFYGVGGIGKTTFAAGAPNPIFLFTEQGQGLLDVPRFEPAKGDPVIHDWSVLIECLQFLYNNEHPYRTVVLDTLDFAEPLLWDYTIRKHNERDIESFGYGKGYKHAATEGRLLLKWLDALRNDRGMIIILVAHSQVKKFEDPAALSYDRWQLKLHDNFGGVVYDWADACLFAAYRQYIVTEDAGFGKKRARGDGGGERVIYCEERPAWQAKNRYSLPAELPLPKEGGWSVFQNAVFAARPTTGS
jgi:hypothetical protein